MLAAALLLACCATPLQAQGAGDVANAAAISALKQKCLDCHDDPKIESEAGKSMTVLGDDFQRSAHRKLDCSDCHATAATVKHPKEALGAVKPEVCQECHADEFKAIAGSIHGRRAKGDKAVKDCMGCHDSLHLVRKGGDPASTLSPVNQIKTCGACHEEMMANYERSEHAHALLKSGLTVGAPSCSSCHGKHDIHPKTEAAATTNHLNIPETCGKCHAGILREWQTSAHGALWKKNGNGDKKAGEGPVCSSCHEPHAIKRPDSAQVRGQVADRCGNCHEKVAASFKDSFHGKASELNNRKAAVCADCHTPHHNLPKSDPKSSIHPDNLAQTCGACHKNVNASFLTFDPHSNPKDPNRNAIVYWLWLGMTSLLVGVFGFFGLHGLLWMQRAVVGKLRGEFTFGHGGDGPYVRRFSKMQMGVHVTIVSSFLLLAATGLPLKFAGAPWAPSVMAVFGGAETAGVLHRLAGMVTFGYFAVHLGMLLHGWFVKKERGYLWGPTSMVPQPKDLFDFIGMIKYFLYLGPKPKFDRFTYWEKFDYLAVFWGVAIIGLSGLMLWQPTAATTFLPGWVLNAAYIVHSDEALLATGFIFLFHFFHTHLRPEAFPLDPVVFVGRMPLARFKEERTLEYERLVAEGKLDDYLMPPPTPEEWRRAYIFGFTAVTIGVVLAVFIFWALLSGIH
ncbi:cytochrome c3 family protein [Rubrivivax sp. A210]|uniref:cytochrome c3 family protein n=1 Tax=Rubrivivax sp. A210 TaxID=2772301 RepID=UPI001917CCED|nr:cytochrome c3 family protein [Rubrivivax sp. A210]